MRILLCLRGEVRSVSWNNIWVKHVLSSTAGCIYVFICWKIDIPPSFCALSETERCEAGSIFQGCPAAIVEAKITLFVFVTDCVWSIFFHVTYLSVACWKCHSQHNSCFSSLRNFVTREIHGCDTVKKDSNAIIVDHVAVAQSVLVALTPLRYATSASIHTRHKSRI